MGKNKFLIPILLVFVLTLQINQVYAEDFFSRLEVRTTNILLSAGKSSNITIAMFNMGSYDVTEVDVQLSSSVTGLSIISNGHNIFNKIRPEESGIVEPTLYVDQNLAIGSYTLTLTGSYIRLSRTITLNVPITVLVNKAFQPMVKVTTINNKMSAGEVTSIGLVLENIGGEDLKEIDVVLSSNSQFISLEDIIRFETNELRAGTSTVQNITVRTLENTPLGAYTLSAQLYYSDKIGNRFRQSLNLPIELSSSIVSIIPVLTVRNLVLTPVNPGEIFTLELEVQCEGGSTYNTRATISLDQSGLLSPLSKTTIYLGDLEPGVRTTLTYDFVIDGSAPSGQIPISLTLRYTDSKGVQGTSIETLTILVEDIINFGFLEDLAITAEKGKEKTLESDILLFGTGSVEFARIDVVPSDSFSRVTGSTEYIGAIDPDSPVPFSLKFGVDEDTQLGDHNLKIRVSYTDNRNQPKSQDIETRITVIEPVVINTTTSDSGIWGWIRQLLGLSP